MTPAAGPRDSSARHCGPSRLPPSLRPRASVAVVATRRWSACERVRLVLEDEAVEAEQDHHADDRSDQPAEVEHLVVADPEQLGEDEEADDRAAQSEQDRGDETHFVLTWHQQPT